MSQGLWVEQRGFEYEKTTRGAMGLHGGSWRIHSSAVDNIDLIAEALAWLAGDDSVIDVVKGKSAIGAPQTTLIARLSKKGALKSLGRLSEGCLERLLEEGLDGRIDDEKVLHLRISIPDLVRGEAMLCDGNDGPVAKGRFKIEGYPGDDIVVLATDMITKLTD
jgi:RNA binding exosome subunit